MKPVMLRSTPDGLKKVPPAHWRKVGDSVVWCCPFCAIPRSLPEDHVISNDGHVEPTLECESPGCHFSHSVNLDGWRG